MKVGYSSMPTTINGFEDLASTLRHWSVTGDEQYDFVGVVHLFSACTDNLRQYAQEAEIEEIGTCLGPEQIRFLLKIAECLKSWQADATS